MSNAKLLEKAFNQAVNQVDISRVHPELNRVIIHGLLHLIGYDDHTVEETAVMRMKENYYLSLRELL